MKKSRIAVIVASLLSLPVVIMAALMLLNVQLTDAQVSGMVVFGLLMFPAWVFVGVIATIEY